MPLREGIGGGPLTGARSMSELMDLPFDEFTRHARGEPRPVANDVHDTPPPNRHRRFEPPTSVLASPSPRGIPFDLDDHDPSDVAYAFSHSGYAPASCRLIHHALTGSLRLIDDVLRALPGPHFEYTQGFDASDGSPAVVAVDARGD